ncbi:MAG: small multi-drug export protein [Desulfobacterales bacterium]|nr:small multi-drug export protein [Desulfobacterales bacterium]
MKSWEKLAVFGSALNRRFMDFLKCIRFWRRDSSSLPKAEENLIETGLSEAEVPDNGCDFHDHEDGGGKALYQSGEGHVFLLGLLLSIVFVILTAYYLTVDIETGQTLLLALIAHTLGGRAAGIGLCIAFEFSSLVTIAYNMFLEVLIVCYCYSLFVFSFNNYLNCKWLTIATKNAEKQALKHKAIVARYGWWGIFVFVMIPLPITGPAAGSIIAYFLKFSIKRNFAAVFSGTLVSILIWTCFFDYLDRHIAIFKYIVAAGLLVLVLYYFKTIKRWFTQEIE